MRVLVAPDKFKGSLTAPEVAAAVAAGLRRAVPGVEVDECPIADGGEGTLDAVLAAGFRRVPVTVEGPTGEPVQAAFAQRDGVAVVELAAASGLHLLPGGVPAPLTASSHGTGQLVAAALDHGATTVLLGVGGSACTDGGAGLAQALGAGLFDAAGDPLPRGGAALARLHRLDLDGLHPRLPAVEVVVACDVDNSLLGPAGAAAVYGPQKGASPAQVAELDAALHRWARAVAERTGHDLAGRPGAGAAGGVGFAALALLGATLRPGIELVLDLTGFAGRLAVADLVITGEGSLDAQTLRGKGPAGVAAAARAAGRTALAVAGRVTLTAAQLHGAGFAASYALADVDPDPARCMAQARPLLEVAATRLAAEWLHLPTAPR